MKQKIKRIDIKEFRKIGYLQELNRQFLHPLGLALEIAVNKLTGEEKLNGIRDYRDDPEGIIFSEKEVRSVVFGKKIERIKKLQIKKAKSRKKKLGYIIQCPKRKK